MSGDGIYDLARQRLIEDSLEIERQLSVMTGARPVVAVLSRPGTRRPWRFVTS